MRFGGRLWNDDGATANDVGIRARRGVGGGSCRFGALRTTQATRGAPGRCSYFVAEVELPSREEWSAASHDGARAPSLLLMPRVAVALELM